MVIRMERLRELKQEYFELKNGDRERTKESRDSFYQEVNDKVAELTADPQLHWEYVPADCTGMIHEHSQWLDLDVEEVYGGKIQGRFNRTITINDQIQPRSISLELRISDGEISTQAKELYTLYPTSNEVFDTSSKNAIPVNPYSEQWGEMLNFINNLEVVVKNIDNY